MNSSDDSAGHLAADAGIGKDEIGIDSSGDDDQAAHLAEDTGMSEKALEPDTGSQPHSALGRTPFPPD